MRHARHARHCGVGPAFGAFGPQVAMAGHRGGPHHGPWGWGGWGPTGRGGFGPGAGAGRRGRKRRGDVRAAILLLLEEQPRNGYGVMQEVEERSGGEWRPSPGSVYPALSQLEDEGLIAPASGADGKAFALTDAGRAHVEEHRDRLGTPWETAAGPDGESVGDLRTAIGQVAMATMQVAQAGDPQAVEAARKVLDDARRSLYRLLAGDDDERRPGA
jgi:DNA-binding PadR family transcriptional regulator